MAKLENAPKNADKLNLRFLRYNFEDCNKGITFASENILS